MRSGALGPFCVIDLRTDHQKGSSPSESEFSMETLIQSPLPFYR